jgi:tellurite resistance protein TerC
MLNWFIFTAIVLVLIIFDLKMGKGKEEPTIKESIKMTIWYFIIGLAYAGVVYLEKGSTTAQNYINGFVVEKSLSLDNVFVFSLIFAYFAIPAKAMHRVLFWGIMGAIVLRVIMILLGAAIIEQFHSVMYIFGAFLIFTGIKMLVKKDDHGTSDMSKNKVLKLVNKYLRVEPNLHGEKFMIRKEKVVWFTPLFVALIMVAIADVVFAVDSVPAIFSITTDTYVVITCNVMALLGMRAMFYALEAILKKFKYLEVSLALVLVFIGAKIFIHDFTNINLPETASLAITVSLLLGGIVYSIYHNNKKA